MVSVILLQRSLRWNKINNRNAARQDYVNAAVNHLSYTNTIVDFVVQCRGRRHIHHVPSKRNVIGCNNFASWIIVDTYSIMLMRLQELYKSYRASCYFILYFIFFCKNFILFYCKWASGLRTIKMIIGMQMRRGMGEIATDIWLNKNYKHH